MRLVAVKPTGSVARAVWMANAPRAQATNVPATISFPGILHPAPLATGPSVLHLNLASLLRSALGWKGIVPGAQTERRGGAGPAGGLLGGKDPAGRFADFVPSDGFANRPTCRTVLQTVLFLAVLRG